ncbi:putative zinc binding domain DUF701 [Trichuris suis]|nr:putative zinc binding domain DUF701 [Trichuris suis]
MGRRKVKRKLTQAFKNIQPLDTLFDCPFCNHEKTCEVTMDREHSIAMIKCRICLEEFQTGINYLSEPIDVYGDWIDACEQSNK